MPETTDDPTARVSRGAALLDEQYPGWAAKIDPGRLDVNSGCDCMAGQLAGSYARGLNLAFGDEAWDISDAQSHGFHPVGSHRRGEADADALTRAWRAAIRLRTEAP